MKNPTDTHSIGIRGENVACDYLMREGYSIKKRNMRNKGGETDIIAENETHIIFVEVKMRSEIPSHNKYGRPSSAVNTVKKKRLINSALCYLKENPTDKKSRIDVIEILESSAAGEYAYKIKHIRAAVSQNDYI